MLLKFTDAISCQSHWRPIIISQASRLGVLTERRTIQPGKMQTDGYSGKRLRERGPETG